MSQSPPPREAAMRRAGAVAALAAASALVTGLFPGAEARAGGVVLALHAILLLGCAAVLLSPAQGAVANDLARRRATEAALGAPSGSSLLRWLGFAGIVLCAVYVSGDVAARNEAAAEAEDASPDTVKGVLLSFLMFLAGVWAVHLSMVWGTSGAPPPAPPEEDPDQRRGACARRSCC